MPKGRPLRNRNGYGTVVKLSGKRRSPFEVRVNTRMDERNYPKYDVLGRFETREKAMIELAKYNENPYDLINDKLTFKQVYEMFYKRKFENSKKVYSRSSIDCTKGAFNKCSELHSMIFKDIRTMHMQKIIDNHDLSHAYMEHIQILFNQMYKYAIEFDIINKNYASFVKITKEDDDETGVPFTPEEIALLWKNKDKPFVDSILIYIYSGWRLNELLKMPTSNINLENRTFQGGIKTKASKNRIVPIHSKIFDFVSQRVKEDGKFLFMNKGKPVIYSPNYYNLFRQALVLAEITTKHTPHDCRHTFATMLDNANANRTVIKRLLGHSSGNDITEKIYTHKDIEQLRKNIELI